MDALLKLMQVERDMDLRLWEILALIWSQELMFYTTQFYATLMCSLSLVPLGLFLEPLEIHGIRKHFMHKNVCYLIIQMWTVHRTNLVHKFLITWCITFQYLIDMDIESNWSWPLDIKWAVCWDLIDIQEVLKQSAESGSHSYMINI